jgi:hypothetical protein
MTVERTTRSVLILRRRARLLKLSSQRPFFSTQRSDLFGNGKRVASWSLALATLLDRGDGRENHLIACGIELGDGLEIDYDRCFP